MLDISSLIEIRFGLSGLNLKDESKTNGMYSVLTDEPLYLLYPNLSKPLTECSAACLSFFEQESTVLASGQNPRRVNFYKTKRMHRCNDLTSAYKHDFSISAARSDYSATAKPKILNEIFSAIWIKEILERKDYFNIVIVFLTMTGFPNRVLANVDSAQLTSIYTLYSDIVNLAIYSTPDLSLIYENVNALELKIRMLNICAENSFEHFEGVNLITLIFQVLGYILDDLYKFGSLLSWGFSSYEQFTVTIKTFMRMTSMPKRTAIEKAVHQMSTTLLELVEKSYISKIGVTNSLCFGEVKARL